MRTCLIFDTDMGIDDAAALALGAADPVTRPDLLLVSPGNTDLRTGCRNAHLLSRMLGLSVPVVMGCPLTGADAVKTEAGTFHGPDGLGGMADSLCRAAGLSENDLSDTLPFDTLCRMAEQYDAIDVITVGPPVNLRAMLACPALKSRLRRILVMGGGLSESNMAHGCEFNFSRCPDGVRALLCSGADVTLFPLDLTNHQMLTEADLDALEKAGARPDLLTLLRYNLSANRTFDHIDGAVLHDAMPVLYARAPDAFTVERRRIACDRYGRIYESAEGGDVNVAVSVRDGLLFRSMAEALGAVI